MPIDLLALSCNLALKKNLRKKESWFGPTGKKKKKGFEFHFDYFLIEKRYDCRLKLYTYNLKLYIVYIMYINYITHTHKRK